MARILPFVSFPCWVMLHYRLSGSTARISSYNDADLNNDVDDIDDFFLSW